MPNSEETLYDLEYLADLLDNKSLSTNIDSTIIEMMAGENTPLHHRIYKVKDLGLEIDEDGFVFLYDSDDVILNNHYVASVFPLKSIEIITFCERQVTITIIGDSYEGYIRIKY